MALKVKEAKTQKLFWDIWAENQNYLFNTCLIYTGRKYHDAQDLLSSVMCKARSKVNKKLLSTNPQSWFTRLIRNTYIDQYRRENCCELNISYIDCFEKIDSEYVAAPITPIDNLLQNELNQYIEISLQKIPPRRKHFTRLYFSGYSYADISNTYCISQDAVRKIIQFSREELRHIVDQYQNGHEAQEYVENKVEQKQYFSHLFSIKQSKKIHYLHFESGVPPNRLEQKEASLKKYLENYPYADEKRLSLAENLSSQGKVFDAVQNLKQLIINDFHHQRVYDLYIELLDLLNEKQEMIKIAEKASNNLSAPPPKFYAWVLIAQGLLEEAIDFIKANLCSNSANVSLRLLLIKVYSLMEQDIEAYHECEEIRKYNLFQPEIFPVHLKNKLTQEGLEQAKEYAQEQQAYDNTSVIASIYHLHFLLSENKDLTNKEVSALYIRLRKKAFWHPDFALIKALIELDKTSKILQRRCRDYPACVLSKYYLNMFSGSSTKTSPLNLQEKTHLSIVSIIHGKRRI